MAALAAYRHLLRSANLAFKGDTALLHASRSEIKANFQKNASLPPDDPEVVKGIEHAQDVAKILRENIVQGEHVGDDRYSEF